MGLRLPREGPKRPPRFQWWKVVSAVRNGVEGWWLRSADAVQDAWQALRRRR
ncbi:hypothetical protein [Streptomyces sp. NPDC059009]|uniref:hypothetical protein n=1 Tax=Streptomyces sp. NPDC059009 TaxID=3346694 RepID=UPI0036B8C783